MKIVADANIPFVKEAFADFGPVLALPGREIRPEIVADATIVLVRSITPVNRELCEGTNIRFVGTATIGVDHIDTGFLTENSIGFASAPGSNANSVAEYIVSALLQIEKSFEWDLATRTLGIVGVGNVGSRVLNYAQALGMRCLLCDPPKQRLTGSGAHMLLQDVLDQADIVTLHVPLSTAGEDATAHMVNKDFLGRMKKGAVLINTSRGGVVDESALHAQRSRLGGFIADVWENEPAIDVRTVDIADIATPHIAGYSFDGKVNGIDMIHQAACAFFFYERKWRPHRHMNTGPVETIHLSSSKNPVLSAVTKAYAIMDDDQKLRKIKSFESDAKRGNYFDMLRKEYPQRREFSNYSVVCGNKNKDSAPVLEKLGFKLAVE